MQATGASLRGIARINQDHPDARPFRLVLDKGAELGEGPGVMQAPLRLAEPGVGAIPDTFQVFEDHCTTSGPGLANNRLADLVVDPGLVAVLFSRKPFEDAPSVLSRARRSLICLRLKRLANSMPLQSVGIECRTAKGFPTGQCGDLLDSQVNAKGFGWGGRFGKQFFNLNIEEVPLALLGERGAGGGLPSKGLALVVANIQDQPLPTGEQGEAHSPVAFPETEDPGIVVNTGRLEDTVPGFGLEQPGSNPGNGPDCEVGRQAKPLPHLLITGMVQGKLAGHIMLAPVVGHEVAGPRKRLEGRLNVQLVVREKGQLAGDGADAFHAN